MIRMARARMQEHRMTQALRTRGILPALLQHPAAHGVSQYNMPKTWLNRTAELQQLAYTILSE